MKKILLLTDKYFPRPYANAICAQEIIRELNKDGYIIDILAYKDFDGNPSKFEGNNIYYIEPDLRTKLFYYADTYKNTQKGKIVYWIANLLSKVKGTILLPWQPFFSFLFPQRIYKKICLLQKQNNYDAIIAIMKPLDTNLAACRFKSEYRDLPYIVYCVDTLKKAFIEKYIGKGFADGFMWEKKILKHCDAFFYMQSRRDDYSLPRYDSYRDKLIEADMPRFNVKDLSKIQKYDFEEEGEHWVYAGSIGGVHYNPEKLIEIFKQISNNPKRILHLYTRGTASDRIAARAKKEGINIRVHGYVDLATLERIMATADVIVSLKTSNQISAKIFECISYGKPIVHFSGHVDDPDIYYLKKYYLCKIIKTYKANISKEILELENFLENVKGRKLDMEILKQIYRKNTPAYSANAILEQIKTAKGKIK